MRSLNDGNPAGFSRRALPAALALVSAFGLMPVQDARACACGCGVFDVGTSSMFPTSSGKMVFLEYDYLNQTENYGGNSRAAAGDNPDKQLRSHFLMLGGQFMVDRSWGLEVELPYTFRYFETTTDSGSVGTFNHGAFGDVRVMGVYTGFSADMSTGLTYGLRLPTGDSTFSGFDPDTEISSGSTDLLVGVYHLGSFTADHLWDWFIQANLDQPILTKKGYLPGSEIDAAYGAYYNGFGLGGSDKIAPILQLLASLRASDHGGNPAADPANTGYERLLISPGVETDLGEFKLYGDVEVPIYQYVNGMQLVAPVQFKTIVSYAF